MKKLFLFLVFLIPLGSFAEPVKWKSFNEALKQSIKEKKPMLLSISGKFCPYCRQMDEKTYTDEVVLKELAQYYVVARIDEKSVSENFTYKGKTYSYREFLSALNVRGVPTTVFFNRKGQGVASQAGYIPAKLFSVMLGYIRKGCYSKKVNFQSYKQDPTKCQDS